MPVHQLRNCRRRSIGDSLEAGPAARPGVNNYSTRMGFLRRCLSSSGSEEIFEEPMNHMFQGKAVVKHSVGAPVQPYCVAQKTLGASQKSRAVAKTEVTCTTSPTAQSCLFHDGRRLHESECSCASGTRTDVRVSSRCHQSYSGPKVDTQGDYASTNAKKAFPVGLKQLTNRKSSCTFVKSVSHDKLNDSEGRTSQGTKRSKQKVAFAHVEFRDYGVVLGDHPCCSCGPPVTLGWDYTAVRKLRIDDYEDNRAPRRTGRTMTMDYQTRKNILISSGQCTEGEIRKVERRMTRARTQKSLVDLFKVDAR